MAGSLVENKVMGKVALVSNKFEAGNSMRENLNEFFVIISFFVSFEFLYSRKVTTRVYVLSIKRMQPYKCFHANLG